MLTLNTDQHRLMNRMHRPDPKTPPNMQDKRSVVPISIESVDTWLFGSVEQATQLIVLPEVDSLAASPSESHHPRSPLCLLLPARCAASLIASIVGRYGRHTHTVHSSSTSIRWAAEQLFRQPSK